MDLFKNNSAVQIVFFHFESTQIKHQWIESNNFCCTQKFTVNKYLLSSFNIFGHPVCAICGLYCRQAVVFFQCLVGHSGLQQTSRSRLNKLLTTVSV